MSAHTKLPPVLILVILLSALVLTACGGRPDPIIVYVTPTPADELSDTVAQLDESTLIGANLDLYQDTPTPIPSGGFGPIVGPNYTPAPLNTPLPDMVKELPCGLTITGAQVALFQSPDVNSTPAGVAYERDALQVTQVTTDAADTSWAQTPRGWLAMTDAGTEVARLDRVRACDILTGVTPESTLLGLHVLNGTSDQAVLSFVRRMAESGHPVSTIKGLNSTENLINEIEATSPETVTVYRSLLSGDGFGDCPVDVRQEPDPASTAQRWMDGLEEYWHNVNADYFEVINECPASLQWINDFMIEVMKIANERGRCLLLFSFPGGHPDMQNFNTILPAYQYALDHQCQPGRTHGIALHAYSMQDGLMLSQADVWVARRHEIIYERLLETLPAAVNLPVYLTEVGIGGGQTFPGCDTVIRDALLYTYQLETAPYVKGFHLWSVGTGTGWYDITECLPALADELIRYYSD